MFKPLLRTLPQLSGNIKIACSLSDYHKLSNTDNVDWECYVRQARLLPLSSQLSQRNIECNLLYSSYEYDIMKYFRYYSSVFYDDCFEFDKNNFIEIDKTKAQKNRNTDFEFGCKRVSYLKNDAQFAFYTPIYLESIDDMPDYFKINIILKNEKYTIQRNLKINISKEDKRNYLNIYLKRYLSGLDSNVIFCNTNANQGTYYGIDLLKGGFVKTVDHIIAKAYARQNTINNFDAIVTNGFKRNYLAIRQVLPLCWYFNVNDMLSEEEREKFANCTLHITGLWYKNGIEQSFYSIDTNYQSFFDYPYMINTTNGIFSYKDTGNNIMNMEYPSLNESMYNGYRYSNKISLKYNRWKLKYSDDEHPYITNLSPAFSINQNSMYRYGSFPEKYTPLNVITDTKNNIIIPIGNALVSKESPYYNDYKLVTNYINTINNNVSTWYTLVQNVDNLYEQNIWGNVQDDKVYYKGILYDFSKIYDTYPQLKTKIDKFSVIVNLHYNILSKEEIDKINKADISIFNTPKYITDRTAWVSERIPEGFSSGEFAKLPAFYNTDNSFGHGNAQLVFDKLYIKDENGGGDFIDMLSLGYNPYDINKYYKYSDIIYNFNSDNGYYDNIVAKLTKNEDFNTYFNDGYEMLPIYKLNNVLHDNDKDIMFEGNSNQQWILDNLYFSQHGNYHKSQYDRDTLKILFEDYGDDDKMIPLYLKGKFISRANFIAMLYYIYGEYWSIYEHILKNLVVYEYHPRIKDETSATYACDVYVQKDILVGDNYGNNIPEDTVDEDVLFVDRYNLNNVIDNYNARFGTNYSLSDETYEHYAKFLNMKHLLFYVSELYKDANSVEDIEQLAKSLYIRKRMIIGNNNTENLIFKDCYIPILNLYDKFRLISADEKIAILKSNIELNTETQTNEDSHEDEVVISSEVNLYDSLTNLGIYVKENGNIYRTDSYKLDKYAEIIPKYWICNKYNCKHPVKRNADGTFDFSNCADYGANGTQSGGTMYYGYDIPEYHGSDFYYRPDFYVRYMEDGEIKFTKVLDYLKDPKLYTVTTYDYDRVYLEEALQSWKDGDNSEFYYATLKDGIITEAIEENRYDSKINPAEKEYHLIDINSLYDTTFKYDSLKDNYLYIDKDLINVNRDEYVRHDEYTFFNGDEIFPTLYELKPEEYVTYDLDINDLDDVPTLYVKNGNDYQECNINIYGLSELPTIYVLEDGEYKEYNIDAYKKALINHLETDTLYKKVDDEYIQIEVDIDSLDKFYINGQSILYKKNPPTYVEYPINLYNLSNLPNSLYEYVDDEYVEYSISKETIQNILNEKELYIETIYNPYSIDLSVLENHPTLYSYTNDGYHEYLLDINKLDNLPTLYEYVNDEYVIYTGIHELLDLTSNLYVKNGDDYVRYDITIKELRDMASMPSLFIQEDSNKVRYYVNLDNIDDNGNLIDEVQLYVSANNGYEAYVIESGQAKKFLSLYNKEEWVRANIGLNANINHLPYLYTANFDDEFDFETNIDLEHFPQLYKKSERKYSILSNPELLNYINYETIKILLTEDLTEDTLDAINLGNGRHTAKDTLGFDNIDIDEDTFNCLLEIQQEIKEMLPKINDLIYVKSYLTGRYSKYNKEFTGINDFEILDDINMKIAIINKEINLITYTIDERGEFIEHPYDEDNYYVLRNSNDQDWEDYLKNVVSQFVSDVEYHESNNYYTMGDAYNQKHDLDNIIGINDIDGQTKSDFTFEVVYKKEFNKINEKLFNLINLTDDSKPYKDLYIYRLYKADEYPAALRMFYTNELSPLVDYKSIHYSLYPLFDDIILQDKKYSVIYSEYSQANIYTTTVGNDKNYRYNLSDSIYMYDISNIPIDKEYEITYNGEHRYAYTKQYYTYLASSNDIEERRKIANHMILPTYSLVNNCYSNISYVIDSLNIYDKFNINTYSYKEYETYTYSYNDSELAKVYRNGSYYTELVEVEREGYGIKEKQTTYGFILMDAYIDNTNSSFNIVDTKYKKKKFYSYINGHDIYDPNFNVMDSFNLLIPFSRINMIDNLLKFDSVITHPTKCTFDTFYKQVPLTDDFGYTYSYNINMKENRIDVLTLQRYFDSIVPYIPETNVLNSTYCLKYKDYKYSTGDINYTNDVFYSEDVNMYNYNKLKVYDTLGSYSLYTPIEYKHLNDNKMLNLPEYFEINEKGKFKYDELIELEREEVVIEKFKKHVLMSKLNQFDDNEILFLYNKYKVEYDTKCIGLNGVKTQKLYTLTYKFTLL